MRQTRRALLGSLAAVGASRIASATLANCTAPPVQTRPAVKPRRIGFVTARTPTTPISLLRTLPELGWMEGRDFVLEHRTADGDLDRLPAVIAELVSLPVDVLVTSTVNPTKAAMQATKTTPIVFTGLADPVGRGIVASLARPGSNVTGVATEGIDIAAKRLELLKETVPHLSRIAVLTNNLPEDQAPSVAAMQRAGQALGVDVDPVSLSSLSELEGALEVVAKMRPGAITTLHAYTFWLQGFARLRTVLDFAVTHRLPQTYNGPEFVRAGGLMGLGEDVEDTYRNLAQVVDLILRGANPGDVPVAVATRFLLALNLSMANRIGFTFPDSVRRQATEIIQ